MTLADKLKELRKQRGWTQLDVAKASGLRRSYISYLENPDHPARPSAKAMLGLAKAFNIKVDELHEAAGYVRKTRATYVRPETPDEILERLKRVTPISIPVYTDFPYVPGDTIQPIDYVYRARPRSTGKNMEGYIVQEKHFEPLALNGDIIIIDKDADINSGDLIACLIDNQFCVARLKKIEGELWLENNVGRVKFQDCEVALPVIEIRRRLK